MVENMKLINELGGPNTYEHYPTGWLQRCLRLLKCSNVTQTMPAVQNVLCDYMAKGIKAHGETRNQYHHAVDLVPTILDICGLEMPAIYHGVPQIPLSGVS